MSVGNCVRLITNDQYGTGGNSMLELSFPALKGASGAPVVQIDGAGLLVRGVMVANAEHHLLPAHIVTYLNEHNELEEETRYFLPQGLAVNSVHLVQLVDDYLAKKTK